jgi:hypothetical protein
VEDLLRRAHGGCVSRSIHADSSHAGPTAPDGRDACGNDQRLCPRPRSDESPVGRPS